MFYCSQIHCNHIYVIKLQNYQGHWSVLTLFCWFLQNENNPDEKIPFNFSKMSVKFPVSKPSCVTHACTQSNSVENVRRLYSRTHSGCRTGLRHKIVAAGIYLILTYSTVFPYSFAHLEHFMIYKASLRNIWYKYVFKNSI